MAAEPQSFGASLLARLRNLLGPRARTLALMVPLHLVAFGAIYLATDRLLQSELVSMASVVAADRLSEAAGEVKLVGLIHSPRSGHPFSALTEGHRQINFRLFLPGGSLAGAQDPPAPAEHREIVAFLRAGSMRRFWLSEAGGRHEMRGLERIVADAGCAPCHPQGETLAVASTSLDLTKQIGSVRIRSRRNLALLILAWALALGATTTVAARAAKRSAARLEADLAAAEAGAGSPVPLTADLGLDSESAELHRSLRRFLRRRQERDAEVASRLTHTDQLASLGQLAAGLAHEIKNPLAGIQGALEILREDTENETDRELCNEMLGELKRVNETLQSLLTSARPAPPRRRPEPVSQLLEEVRRLMSPGLRRRGVELEVEASDEELTVSLDAGKIRQVLVNLVNNAAEAMDDGGRVRLRAGRLPDAKGVIIAVEDDGPGIPEASIGNIFVPFFTTKFSGTGLGLPIARRLVEQHGGSLQFETSEGEGTTFYLLLPADLPDDSAAESRGTEPATTS